MKSAGEDTHLTRQAFVVPRPGSMALARVFAYLVFIDLLLFPYFPLFVMPYTLGIVVLWAICRTRVSVDHELGLFFVLAACVIVSATLSIAYRSIDLIPENFKRAGQLLSSFGYYFFFRWLARDRKFDPKPVLLAFVTVHAMWSLWFLASPESALKLASRLYPLAALSMEGNLMFRRFSYFFTDPNTNGFLIAIVGLFLAQFGNMGTLGSAAVLGAVALGAITSGSRGVLVALALAAGLVVVHNRRRLFRHAFRSAMAIAVVGLVAGGAFRYWYSSHPADTAVFLSTARTARERLVGREGESFEDVMLHGDTSAGESRISIYRWEVTHLWPLPLGRGYQILAEGAIFRPHSDFFRMLYSYGFVACGVMLFFLFRDGGAFYFAIPAAMAFAINTLIDEQKLLVIFLALLAIARVRAAGAKRLEHSAAGRRTRGLFGRKRVAAIPMVGATETSPPGESEPARGSAVLIGNGAGNSRDDR